MQVKVPLPLLQYEDKIIGPFTVKQFIYLLLGIGIGAVIFYSFPVSLRLFGFILALPVVVVFGGLMFFKINDRPADVYIFAILNIFLKPRFRVFRRENTLAEALPPSIAPKVQVATKEKVSRSRLEDLARVMDTRGKAPAAAGLATSFESVEEQAPERINFPQIEATQEIIEAESMEDKIDQKMDALSVLIDKVKTEIKPELKKIKEAPISVVQKTAPIQYESPKEQLNLKKEDYRDIIDMAYQYTEAQKQPQ